MITKYLLSCFMVLATTTLFAQKSDLKVSFIIGDVQYKPQHSNQWQPLQISSRLGIGDSVLTQNDSRVEIENTDKAVIKINANFRNLITASLIRTAINNSKSSTMSKFLSKNAKNVHSSPTATAAIRGKVAAGADVDKVDLASDSTDVVVTSADQSENTYAAYTELPVTEEDAKILLDEALKLRQQFDELITQGNLEAAQATLELSEKLTQRVLQILE